MYKIVLILINLRYKAVNDSQVQWFKWYWIAGSKTGSWIKARVEYFKKSFLFTLFTLLPANYFGTQLQWSPLACVGRAQTFGAKLAYVTH